MRFSLDVLRAAKGDCLMLHYGTPATPRLMVIDGGPSGVYRPHLRPRLERVRQARRLDGRTPLPIDVLMVSHVDDDHIRGVLDLTSELRLQKADRQPPLVHVRSLWHNAFDDLLDTTPQELDATAGAGVAALSGSLGAGAHDGARVLASIPQGRALRDDAAFLAEGASTWTVNGSFGGRLILAHKGNKRVTLTRGVGVTVIGPMQSELAALQKAHDAWLRKHKQGAASAAALAAFLDRSVPNLSSLVMLIEAGRKRMLLTGDARGDKIIKGLQLAGLLAAGTRSTMHVDVLKVPHHGSANNVDESFFARITADHYVLSGNGEHGNPERQAIEMLCAARGSDPYALHFTYPLDEIDAAREIDWETQRASEKKRGKRPRPPWSAARHSLTAFFASRTPAPGQDVFTINADGEPHVIDLLDPVAL